MVRSGNVGDYAIIEDEVTNSIFGSYLIKFNIDNNKVLNRYFGYFYESNSFKKQLAKITQASANTNINAENIKSIKISYPTLDEQTIIVKFLLLIDKRIETQKKIIEDYYTYIKSILNKIYSSKNKYDKLTKYASIYQPETISEQAFEVNGKYDVYGANGIIGKYSKYNHETSQICITCRGASCGNIHYSNPYSWITGNAMVINLDKSTSIINKKFIYYYLKSISLKHLISGSGQPQITRKPLESLNIPLVTIEEQIKTVKILDTAFEKINNEEKILKLYQKQKDYLLNKMFI